MTFAHITADTIAHVGPLPRIWWDGDRWHDLRDDDDGTQAAALGWLPVTYQPRPDDTATTTWERAEPALIDGLPVVGWTERPKTEAEQAAEAEQDARLDDLTARVAAIEAHLWPAPDDPTDPDDPTVPEWAELVPPHHWPHGTLLREGGAIWRNVSGVPLTTPPSGFPGQPSQWGHLFVEVTGETTPVEPTRPDNYVGDWSAQATYKVGDVVSHNGEYWRCNNAHGAEYQGTWAPGLAHNVWTSIGTV